MSRSHYFEDHPVEIIKFAPGGYAMGKRSKDGIYNDFFGKKPLSVVYNDVAYHLTRLPGVKLSPNTLVVDETLRLHKLNAMKIFNRRANPSGQENINDGLYGETPKGDPAYVIVDGKTYALSPKI